MFLHLFNPSIRNTVLDCMFVANCRNTGAKTNAMIGTALKAVTKYSPMVI